MNRASVDILMATYNGAEYVADQIASVQNQVFRDWRLLISDDCSTDETLEVIREFSDSDDRIVISSEGVRHGGAKENFMSMLSSVEAPYVMFCDQDDVWLPNKINLSLMKMHALEDSGNPNEPLLVFSDMMVVDNALNVISCSFEEYSSIDPRRTDFCQVLAQSVAAGCTMIINRPLYEMCLSSLSSHTSEIIMHDWWFTLIASCFGRIDYVGSPTSLYRQHDSNSVGALEYRPARRLLDIESMRRSVLATVYQADAFISCFGREIPNNELNAIRAFIKMGSSRGVVAVFHLLRSKAWKKGARKAGQIIVAFSGVRFHC